MKIEFSPEQREAIITTNKNVLVFASAGAGKTTVLVERLIKRIIEDKISLNDILAMTFTEAAASNMKYRLLKRLLQEDVNDSYIKEQLSLLETSHISTIHSFCLSLIKEYYYLIDVKKERLNNILNESDQKLLLDKAFNQTIINTKNILSLHNEISTSIFSLEQLRLTVDQIFNKASGTYDPIVWLNNAKRKPITCFEDIDETIRNYYLNDIKSYLKLAKTKIEKLSTIDERYKQLIINVNECINENDYQALVTKLENNFKTLPLIKDEYGKEIRKELAKDLGKIADKLINPNQLVTMANKASELTNRFIDFTIEYYNNYQTLKVENNVLDFDDFEHYAYKLLTINNNEIALKLKAKYKEIMIDEFQDTNDTQYKIASLIADNNLFIVGDIKQSIYRFRNAKPEIMGSLKQSSDFHKIHITNNYRSKINIVNFNNELYTRMMNIVSEGYPKEDIQVPNKTNDSDIPTLLISNSNDFDQYKMIANKIMELHQSGVSFKDMAILVRTHAKKTPIRLALDEYNIPYFIADKEGYLSSKTLDVLISYLKLLLDNNDLISKVSVLSSAIYKLSDNDLIKIKNNNFDYTELNNDLDNLNLLLKDNKLLEIIYYILDINNYYNNLPAKEKANVDLFIQDFDDSYTNLYDLLRYIEDSKNYQSASSASISEDSDVVRVMTFHNSKGLEFPVVFVLSESQNRNQDNSSLVLVDSELGVSIKNVIVNKYKDTYSNIYSLAIKAKLELDSLLEYLRFYYVATTRAIDKLFIVDNATDIVETRIDESLLYARKGFTSYLFGLKYLNIDVITKLKEYAPLPIQTNSNKKLPSKQFNFNIIDTYKASEHQDEKLFYKEVTERGTLVHEFFENLDIYNPTYTDLMSNDVVDNFINSDVIQSIKNYEIHKELEFISEQTHGFMDFVAIGENDIVLIDYKTNVNVDENTLKGLYTNQLETYKNILTKKYQKPIRAYLYSTYLKCFISI